MKFYFSFIKSLKENIRDWKILSMVIVFAPFFVYLMYFYLKGTDSSSYNVSVCNNDIGDHSKELINEWKKLSTDDNKNILNIQIIHDTVLAKKKLRNKVSDLFITIPNDFSKTLDYFLTTHQGIISSIINHGDQTNIRCMMATSFCDSTTFNFISMKTGIIVPINILFESVGRQKKLSEFDLFVPALLVMSIIMILFTAGGSIVREIEKDTLTRLSLYKLNSLEFLFSISMNQILIGILSMIYTFLAALSVGYSTNGSIFLLMMIGIITCFSVISFSIITTCFIRSMFGLLTLGCFPFFILMFFSDCFMPLPKINLFSLFGNQIYLNDILPTATATRAINKVLNFNSGFSEILFEFIWIISLSSVYFMIGVMLFKRKYKY